MDAHFNRKVVFSNGQHDMGLPDIIAVVGQYADLFAEQAKGKVAKAK